MKKVFIHKYGGILSAFGLSMADAVIEEQEAAADMFAAYSPSTDEYLLNLGLDGEKFKHLEKRAVDNLVSQGYHRESVVIERFVVRITIPLISALVSTSSQLILQHLGIELAFQRH